MSLLRILFVIVLPLAALSQQQNLPSRPTQQPFRIIGTVVNAIDGQPLSNAAVSIGPAERDDQVQTMTTAEDGRFEFQNLNPGKYWLAAQRRGFSLQRLDEHEYFSTAIAVGPNLESEGLVFRLRPDAAISGTVTDEQNEAVRGAQAMLFSAALEEGKSATQIRGRAMTDDRGSYHFGHLTPGTYFVAVSAQPWYAEMRQARRQIVFTDGNASTDQSSNETELQQSEFDVTYPVTYYASTTDRTGATPLVLKAGERASADISLVAIPALHLHIVDASIDPSQGAGVFLTQRLFGNSVEQIPAQTTSIKKGEIEISGVPPGQFVLTFQNFGKSPSSREKEIEVSNDAEVDVANASVAPTIQGVVQLDGGRPMSHRALVRLWNRASGETLGAQVSGKGEFEIRDNNAKPGRYEISVFNVRGALLKSVSATGAQVVGHTVEISSGTSVRLSLTMSSGVGRVNGTALRDSKGYAGAMIVLVPQDLQNDSTLIRRDQSDSDGTFSLQNVLPGRYTLVAIENGWNLEWLNLPALQPYLMNGEMVDVSARGKYNVKVKVQ